MNNSRRGSYLILALFFTVIAITASTALLNLIPSEAASLKIVRRDVEANQACEAGVRDWMAFISHQLKNSAEPLSTPSATRSGTLGRWSWSAVATADPSTPPHPRAGLRMYRVESTALWDGTPKRRVTAWLQGGVNFTKYAAFTGHTPPPGLATFVGIKDQTTVEGAFRTNGQLRLSLPSAYWTGSFTNTSFTGLLSASGVATSSDGIDYFMTAPSSLSDYNRMNRLGKSGFEIGASPMALPSGPQPFANSAWGGPPPITPPPGITVNPTGGIYITGTVNKMDLGVDGGGNPYAVFRQGATTTKVTRVTDNPVAGVPVGSRAVEVGGVTTAVSGLGTGTIYASGDILELAGTNKYATTIAVDFSANRNIVICGDLLRADTVVGVQPTSNRDPLGLVAAQVQITDNTSLVPRTLLNTLTLYASLFCNDKFVVLQRTNTSLGPGKMQVFGTVVSNNSWETVQYNLTDMSIMSGMGNPSGYGSFRLVSDPHTNFFPPPVFPASEMGQVEIRYWKETPL
jgi:hypothetical protein